MLFAIVFPAISFAQQLGSYEKKTYISSSDTLNYNILFPKSFSSQKKYPVILFLHGAGERGDDNQSQLIHGSELFLDQQEDFPAIVIFPQAPINDYWSKVEVNREAVPFQFKFNAEQPPTPSLQSVMNLIEEVRSRLYVDLNRIYVGGLSMGGMGTFELIYRQPEVFAAAFSICGAADPQIAEAYPQDFHIWLFHGKKDDIVPSRYSEAMALAINHFGGNAKLSLYPEANHNSWDSAFSEPNLLPWLFSNSK